MQGPDLEELGELLKLPLPGTPPYKLAGKVTHQEQEKRWNFVAAGHGRRQRYSRRRVPGAERRAPYSSRRSEVEDLDLDDLGRPGRSAARHRTWRNCSREQKQKAAQEKRQRRPSCQTSTSMCPSCTRLMPDFSGDTVQAMKLPLEHMEAKVTLEDGHFEIDPARVDVAGGKLESRVGLDAQAAC